MKLFEYFRRNKKIEVEPWSFSVEELKNTEKPMVLYLGNGASSQHYEKLFLERKLTGRELSFGTASTICLACQEIPEEPEEQTAVNGFVHGDAEFAGFLARKKKDGRWLWYTKEDRWEPLSADMPQKRIFLDGESISCLLAEETKLLVLQAQWRGESGGLLNCGYPMFTNQLMAHAFGALEGHTYCNTQAAYENGIKNGYKYFEVDLSYTEDHRLVLCHGWSESNCKHTGFEYTPRFKQMKYRQIMRMKVHGHEIMDARQFYDRIKDHPEYTFEIDFHNISGEDVKNRIRSLLEDFQYDTKVLDRLLIQAYSMQMYQDIDSVYHFKHYQYLVGKDIHRLDEIINFCLDHGICVVALRANLAKPEFVKKIKNAGLYVMCYTINEDISYAKKLIESGVDTICTDAITPKQLEKGKNTFGQLPFWVAYKSGSKKAAEQYSELIGQGQIDGKVKKVKGEWVCEDAHLWDNDGTEKLRANHFVREDADFLGWNLSVKIDGKNLWYCTNHCYHTAGDIKSNNGVQKYLFRDMEQLPRWTVQENMKLTMTAVWKEH